jgi:site-specific DNA recombinase
MSVKVSQLDGQPNRVAAIYARVSSERQRQDETIQSQTVGLRELAAQRGLLVSDDLVFEDEGFSGATLTRPALERLRDSAAEGCFEVLLCHAPDRLARRYAYQVLLLEEFARVGVEVCFAKEPERGATPEDELLRQFQGMIAEYERAQIAERTRRGKLHRARTGHQAVLSCAPYGYRYVKKSEHSDGFWEIDPVQAEVVREVFERYINDGISIGELARWLSDRGVPTRTGKAVWDRSSVWGMLRNTAYRGQAAFGKTKTLERHGKPTRTTRARGERHGRRPARADQPADKWTLIAVPPIVSDETFELAQARLSQNAHFAKRNTKKPTLLQGILVCRECGYGCYRSTTRTTNKRIYYYRCIGSDNYRHIGGRVCQSRPIRADELDGLVWDEVRRLLEDPALVHAEIDRRLRALRAEHPASRRREALERDLTRADSAIARLIEAYQEQLLSIDELRTRMPALRKRQTAIRAQLDTLESELHDAETYLKLADTLEGFLGRLTDGLDQLNLDDQQRVLRLVVREVLIGGDDDTVTIRHSIPTPNNPDDPSYLLRGSGHHSALRSPGHRPPELAIIHHPCLKPLAHQRQHTPVRDPLGDHRHKPVVVNPPEVIPDVGLEHELVALNERLAEHLLRLRRRPTRPEPPRDRQKVGLEDRFQHDTHSLLNHPILHGRDPQQPNATLRLGNRHPPNRQRTITTLLKLGPNLCEQTIHPVLLHRIERLPIDTSSALVPQHAPPRLLKDVIPPDPVIQSMETPTRRPLGGHP